MPPKSFKPSKARQPLPDVGPTYLQALLRCGQLQQLLHQIVPKWVHHHGPHVLQDFWEQLADGSLPLLVKLALQEATPVLVLAHQQHLPQHVLHLGEAARGCAALVLGTTRLSAAFGPPIRVYRPLVTTYPC